jgi:hypothetical protein
VIGDLEWKWETGSIVKMEVTSDFLSTNFRILASMSP